MSWRTAERDSERSASARKRSSRSPALEAGTVWTFGIGSGMSRSGEAPGKNDDPQRDRTIGDVEHGPSHGTGSHVDEVDDPAEAHAVDEIPDGAAENTPEQDAMVQAAVGLAEEEVEHDRD